MRFDTYGEFSAALDDVMFGRAKTNPTARRNMALRVLPGGGVEADTVAELVAYQRMMGSPAERPASSKTKPKAKREDRATRAKASMAPKAPRPERVVGPLQDPQGPPTYQQARTIGLSIGGIASYCPSLAGVQVAGGAHVQALTQMGLTKGSASAVLDVLATKGLLFASDPAKQAQARAILEQVGMVSCPVPAKAAGNPFVRGKGQHSGGPEAELSLFGHKPRAFRSRSTDMSGWSNASVLSAADWTPHEEQSEFGYTSRLRDQAKQAKKEAKKRGLVLLESRRNPFVRGTHYAFFGADGQKRTIADKKLAREETRKAGTGVFWEITSDNPDGRPILVGPAPTKAAGNPFVRGKGQHSAPGQFRDASYFRSPLLDRPALRASAKVEARRNGHMVRGETLPPGARSISGGVRVSPSGGYHAYVQFSTASTSGIGPDTMFRSFPASKTGLKQAKAWVRKVLGRGKPVRL